MNFITWANSKVKNLNWVCLKKQTNHFCFLIPILIAALVFISLSQQNIFVTADSDSDIGTVKIETPIKPSNYNSLLLTSCVLNEKISAPILIANGNAPIFTFLLRNDNNLCSIKNLSPPINITV